MKSEFVTVLFFVIFASCHISAFDVVDGKNFDFQMKGKLGKENDNSIEDRETARVERDGNRDFYSDDFENSDEDFFFAKDNDELKKSFDYSDWETAKGIEINEIKKNDEEEENDERKEKEEEKEQEEEKGILRRLFEKFKNWVHKVGK